MSYIQDTLDDVKTQNANEYEFIQAATEILTSIEPVLDRHPEYRNLALLERFVEPERVITFRIPWVDDSGKVQVNRGYRVQFNSAIGPYKGGLRFHPTVNLSIMKFLALEQTLKNSLTGLPIGGGKGGSNFDPKGKSDREIMAFCQSFMTELYRHVGEDCDVPAGDIGVGAREIGYLFGQYKRIRNEHVGVLTGRGLAYGGSLIRKQATGYGLIYITERALNAKQLSLKGKNVIISGSGNVAIYAAEKAMETGAKVIAMSDSQGYIYDPMGINLEILKDIKEIKRARILEYAKRVPTSTYIQGCKGIWTIKCDVALPCATQNELDENDAKLLINGGVMLIAEGANMPCTLDAVSALQTAGVTFIPAKAANAGGVACSALEMAQSSSRIYWSADKVELTLKDVMYSIYDNIVAVAKEYGNEEDLVLGANIAGFIKVADAMIAQGIV